jgi:hypothetical protein
VGLQTSMGKVYDHIPEDLRQLIVAQHVFFVATAPLEATGHVNVSPKGMDSFRVLSDRRVAYVDLTGSGNETSAHLWQNGRITFMFCAFEGKPNIVRLYGVGRAVLPGSRDWKELVVRFPEYPGTRQIIVADISRVQTSCGFAVPRMDFVAERDGLVQWAQTKGTAGLDTYRREKNALSIDGLPAPVK